ncbi:MAG: cytochrome c1 [Gammaproteobacteria bacterium]|nr:cytochrome c1 [Gammaproteobacteria bacterium]MDH5594597.1 cytochrome c1 [Gammaproteobacteria bacterium]MDH5613945.1 cytochrome c1 [Gammaproteobacteria bacterium]
MKKIIIACLFFVLPVSVMAAGGSANLMHANNDLHDKASLQNGAKLFVNYCLSCHSAKYMRFNRMGRDLGMTDEQVKDNLMFTTDKVVNTMDIAMKPEDAARWFGTLPPDLSVIARSRGTNWLYTYFMSFYEDKSRPFGVNNALFKDVGMPHVFMGLQGKQVLVEAKEGELPTFKLIEAGTMGEEEFANAMRDLVNFLEYLGEPIKTTRQAMGYKVILFLLILFVFAYMLKKEYWKDVH